MINTKSYVTLAEAVLEETFRFCTTWIQMLNLEFIQNKLVPSTMSVHQF